MNFPFTLPTQRQFDAVGFGLNAVDHLIVVPEYPAFDTKIRLLEHKQTTGGQTATTMVALQRLGMNTAYAGRFGSDAEGQFGFESLKSEGVNSEFAEVVEDIWYRTPALKVRGKALCRLREEGDVIVFITTSVEEQEYLIASRPDIYFITDHYRGWPAVLARLCLFLHFVTVVTDYKHSRPKSQTFGQRSAHTTRSGLLRTRAT